MRLSSQHRAIVSILLSFALMAWCLFATGDRLISSSPYLIYALLIILVLPMPSSVAMLVMIAGVGLFSALEQIGAVKASLTGLPLMFLDLQIAASDPEGFIGAMKWPAWSFYGAIAAAVIVFFGLLFASLRTEYGKQGKPGIGSIAGFLVANFTLAAAFGVFSQQLYATIKPPSKFMQETWSGSGLLGVLARTGVVPFVIFTSKLDYDSTSNRFSPANAQKSASQSPAVGTSSANKFVTIQPVRGRDPNIVVVLLESTFDVNKNFDITPRFETALNADYEAALTCPCIFPPRGFRVRPLRGRTDEASKVYRRADHWCFAGAGGGGEDL